MMPRRFAVHPLAADLVAALLLAPPAFAYDDTKALYSAIPETAYAVVAEVRAKPGKADALRAVTLPLVARVRSEPNNLLYFLQEDPETPGHFIFDESS
jgi:hypothetical protein